MRVGPNLEIVESIKSGGTSNLFLAVDHYTGFPVAVKELKPGFFANEMVREKFKEEANRYLYLQHPNIVRLKDFIDTGETYYLIMEYIEGHDLSDYISTISGPLPIYSISLIMNEVLSALQYAHDQNMIHLDLKPSNIMLTRENRVKVIDFGIAHDKNKGKLQAIMGSPAYMSPEQIKGENIDHLSDIYSVGITIFELLSGFLPFRGGGTKEDLFEAIQQQELPEVKLCYEADLPQSGRINSILRRATAKKPIDRYQSCEELQFELIQFL